MISPVTCNKNKVRKNQSKQYNINKSKTMKKTLFALMALAIAFMAVSCHSDDELAQQPTDTPTNGPTVNNLMVINAVAEGIGTGVRATMAYKYDILWSAKDQIYVKNSANNAIYTLKSGENTTNGTFECESSPFESGEAVEAYYPASLVKDGNLVWPAQQTTSTVVPMYSKQTLGSTGTENFSFASLGAILQIVFNSKQENVTLKSITLKDGTNPLSGTFTVNEDGMAVMATNADAPGITYDLGETGKALGDGANYFNIAVPAGTYSNLTITFTATDESTCTLKGNVTINHNTVGRLTLTGSKFKPATTGTEKRSGDINVNWVQLWENGPKFAEYNVGATSVTEYGGYYTWGGTFANGESVWNDDHIDGESNLSCTGDNITDTATQLWGSKWRMPTKEELDNLLAKCDVKWDNTNKGLLCTGKGAYSSNSVFLPAAGTCYGDDDVEGQGEYGDYWSSTANGSDFAYDLLFDAGDTPFVSKFGYRNLGYSVRAVLNENQ